MREIWQRFRALLRKELLQLFSDPKSCFVLVVPAMMQLFVFGYSATFDLKNIDYAVCDRDRSPESRALIAKFEANPIFRRAEDVPAVPDAELEARFAAHELKLVIVVPENFSRDLAGGKTAPVQALVDARNSNSAGTALVYAGTIVEAFNRDRAQNSGGNAASARVALKTRAWFNENFNARFFIIPSLLAAITFMDILLAAALAVAKERDAGTLDQLRLTPFAPWEILTAKGAAIALVGFIQATTCLLVILFWFRIPFHSSLPLLYLLFTAFIFAGTALGILISVLSKTLQRALMTAFFFIVPAVMLSGLLSPVENMPLIFRKISFFNPIRHGTEALRRLFLEGATFTDLAPLLFALCLTGTLASAVALAFFRRKSRD